MEMGLLLIRMVDKKTKNSIMEIEYRDLLHQLLNEI